jgi:hypothetical protein
MVETYEPKFPGLLQLWKGHDLAFHGPEFGNHRPWFYEGLKREDELLVWKFIEEKYLLRYRELIGVRFEWSAEGLWSIPFPGSVAYGEYRSPDHFGMPESLVEKIREWHMELDRLEPGEESPNPDHQASREKGLAAAKGVKAFLGEDYYVEFQPFREIAILNGDLVELEVPEFIVGLTR